MVVHLFVGRPCCAVMKLGSNSASAVFVILPKVTFELNQNQLYWPSTCTHTRNLTPVFSCSQCLHTVPIEIDIKLKITVLNKKISVYIKEYKKQQ